MADIYIYIYIYIYVCVCIYYNCKVNSVILNETEKEINLRATHLSPFLFGIIVKIDEYSFASGSFRLLFSMRSIDGEDTPANERARLRSLCLRDQGQQHSPQN